MCGITGFNWDDKELVRKMCDSISHRGPDGEGCYNDDLVSLGHRRLSIIDLSDNGKQPMSNSNGSIWITFNGEIYNYLEIKMDLEKKGYFFRSKSDTEVIIHAYEEYGEECLHLLNGDFAFAIYDVNKKIIFLARDRLGIKPLYYFAEEDKFIFASEIKAILQSPKVERKVNINALNKFVSYRYNFGEETMFEGIFKVLPGNYLVYNLKENFLTKKQFWSSNFSDNNILNESENYFAKKIQELFKDCVQKRLMSDVPLGVYLSGGIDSSAVVAMMSQLVKDKEPIKTFSVGFGFGEETDELSHAKKVSEKFATDHKEFTVTSDLVNL
ncbi:MAG: asparagine synthase (glutamine-hydrolyzing), partial [Nanoarchaeota archaeon]